MSAAPGAIRLLAVDLDGTLLRSDRSISEASRLALRAAMRAGVAVVIASARPPRSVRPFYRALGLDTPQVNYNGALVWDEPTATALCHIPLSGGQALAMVETARAEAPDLLASCEILDRWCTDRVDERYLTETARLHPPDVVAPLETFCQGEVTKLMLQGPPPEVARARAALEARHGSEARLIQTEPDLLQITRRSADKGAAVALIAARLGRAAHEVLAIGDAENDLGMLRFAGASAAVANAPPHVQAAAQWVAPRNDDDGVVAAMRRFGLPV